MSLVLHGLGVSKGIAIGPVHILRPHIEISEYCIAKQNIKTEIERFKAALETARAQLQDIRDQIPLIYSTRKHHSTDIVSFIDPHMMMLDDSMLTQAPIDIIQKEQCNAEWALKIQRDRLVDVFEAMDNAYLRSRKTDIDQVINRIQSCLLNQHLPQSQQTQASRPPIGSIVLADDLSPADTALIQHQGIQAFITEHGGTNSHTSIIARSLGIPAIVGLRHAQRYIQHTDTLVVDALNGVLITNPDARTLSYYRALQARLRRHRTALTQLKAAATCTLDGTHISLHANIEFPSDLEAIQRVGAQSIGLFRTEFLYMRPDMPHP